jgi:hypothetical protein
VATVANAKQSSLAITPSGLWVPLQAGDTGVRSIDSVTLVSGSNATGTIALAIVRVFGVLPLMGAPIASERDFVNDLPALPRVYDETVFSVIGINASSTVTSILYNEIRLVMN